MNTLEPKGLTCFECKCVKSREEFSLTEDIYVCIDPEDLICDQCYQQELHEDMDTMEEQESPIDCFGI